MKPRLAVVTTHPIQYYAPWFRWMMANSRIELKVFYLWDTESQPKHDPGFGRQVSWDVPLLAGYEYEFVPNVSSTPGTDRFFGIRNPDVLNRVKSWHPDAVLLIGYRYSSLLKLILTPQRIRGFPLIFRGDSHRLGTSQSGKWKVEGRKRVISAIYRRFAAVLYVGRANREYFCLHGVPDEKLFFAPHAVDSERFLASAGEATIRARAWRDEMGIPAAHALILFAGKLEEKKRPQDLLEAFKRLNQPNVSLLFVGNGALERELRAQASLIPHVYFAPFQNQSQMPSTYAAADLFVLPSFGPEESWGLAVNEALCLAKPVIVSSHVGCGANLVQEDVNGLTFEAGNVEALTSALEDALSDRTRLQQWGKNGREIVQAYDYAHATEGLLKALDYVLER